MKIRIEKYIFKFLPYFEVLTSKSINRFASRVKKRRDKLFSGAFNAGEEKTLAFFVSAETKSSRFSFIYAI